MDRMLLILLLSHTLVCVFYLMAMVSKIIEKKTIIDPSCFSLPPRSLALVYCMCYDLGVKQRIVSISYTANIKCVMCACVCPCGEKGREERRKSS